MTPSNLLKPGAAVSEVDLEAIQARVDAATPGPWTVDTDLGTFDDDDNPEAAYVPEALTVDVGEYDAMSVATATFVAHARQDIPALLQEVRRLREENAQLREDSALAAAQRRGKAGGTARASNLSPSRMSEIARMGGIARAQKRRAPVPADGQGEAQ